MPTTKFDNLLVALSLKIGDPVGAAGDDGPIYSSQRRSDYLNRAYHRLRRTLNSMTKDVDLAFNNHDNIVIFTPPADSDAIEALFGAGLDKRGEDLNAHEVRQVYVKIDGTYYRANYVDQNKFVSAKYGLNDYYNTTEEKIFWSEFSGKILLFGLSTFIGTDAANVDEVIFYVISLSSSFISSEEAEAVDIDIDPLYEDLLLSLAAREAMQDRGDAASVQKNQLYTEDFFNEVKVITQRTQVNPESDKIKG